jgi:hypothetical protein
MHDLHFFGAAALLSLVIIGSAMAFDPRSGETSPLSVGSGLRNFIEVEGADLNRFRQSRRDTVTLIRKNETNTYLRVTSRRNNDLPTTAKDVAYIPISTDLQVAFAERNLKITVSARSATSNGSTAMRLQYSAGADGNSDWRSFMLTPEWEEYSFYYTPPPSKDDLGLDFFAVWADPDGLGRGVEIRKLVFDIRAQSASAPAPDLKALDYELP